MVAALASQPDLCQFCGKAGAQSFCQACGKPQPIRGGEDYFSVMGIPRRFQFDLVALEKRFYELSRLLHPDRFTFSGSDPESRRLSLERMSFINQAYQTLKNPERRREYRFELEGLNVNMPKAEIPRELSESWFEIQDALMEVPEKVGKMLAELERSLEILKLKGEKELLEIERNCDQTGDASLLRQLAKQVQSQNYLKSLERDIERVKQKVQSAQGK